MRQPKNPFHPGEILYEEFLTPSGITQVAFAAKLGWTTARLSELIHGKRGVTADAALDLASALGTTAKLWMNLQATYDLDRAMKRRGAPPETTGPLAATTSSHYLLIIVTERINLADPDFEPTDEQLIGLSRRAFSGVAEARRLALGNLRAAISAARVQALQAYEARRSTAAEKE
jgi:addiction module HigA family antidote